MILKCFGWLHFTAAVLAFSFGDRAAKNTASTAKSKAPTPNDVDIVYNIQPGQFTSLRPDDVMQALAFAGNATPFASLNDIRILRRVNGTETLIPFRFRRVDNGRHPQDNIVLQCGGVVGLL
jgi:hypothetical protein